MAESTQQPYDTFLEKIQQAISDSFKAEAERIFEEHKVRMISELDSKKDQIVAGLMINLFSRIEVANMGTTLVIKVESEKLK